MASKHKILVVDDESAICDSLQTFFRFEDYDIEIATNPAKAIEMVKEDSFQIFLVDMAMPNMDGLELLKRIKGIRPTAQVIIMTGFVTQGRILDCFKEGAADFLEKPFKDLMLIQKMVDEASTRLTRWEELLHKLPTG